MKSAKVSIVVPVYNAAKYLPRSHASLTSQTYGNIEIVYVDDGSKDESAELLKRFVAEDKRVKVISQENRGTLMARQAGVEATTGDWITFLDPDDWLSPDACQRAMETSGNNDIVSFGMEIHSEVDIPAAELAGRDKYFNPESGIIEAGSLLSAIFEKGRAPANLCGKLIKGDIVRTAFAAIPKARAIFAEDHYAFYKILSLVSGSFVIIPDRLYHYRLADGITIRKTLTAAKFALLLGILPLLKELQGIGAEAFKRKIHADLIELIMAQAASPMERLEGLKALFAAADGATLALAIEARQNRQTETLTYMTELEGALLSMRSSKLKRFIGRIKGLIRGK